MPVAEELTMNEIRLRTDIRLLRMVIEDLEAVMGPHDAFPITRLVGEAREKVAALCRR